MGSGRGDRNQVREEREVPHRVVASMGSGRGDRNQPKSVTWRMRLPVSLQWGPVVVTGIRRSSKPHWWRWGCFNGVRSW